MAVRKPTQAKPRKAKSRTESRQLRQSEERFQCHLELSSEWYWEQDEYYRFTLLTGAGFDKTGIGQRQFLGTTRWDRGTVPLNGSWDAHRAMLDARQPFTDFVFKRIDAQGVLHYISTSGKPVYDGRKRFRGYRGIGKDISTQVRADQLLRLEHAVARCLSEEDSAPAALKAAMRAICETQNWECGRYFGWDDNACVVAFTEFWHVPDAALEIFIAKSRKLSYAPGVGLVGQVLQSAQPLWVTDLSSDTRAWAGIARDAGMRGTFIFPVLSEGKPIGVLGFHSREVREPEARLLQAVQVIGGQIGQFLQRKQAEERVQHMARHDTLTSLPNRAMFSQLLNHQIQLTQRYERGFALLFIDLDHFKRVNDTMGHEAGDKLLQELSRRFRACLRASDVVARLGGDEFVVLLQESSDTEQIAMIARKLLAAASSPVRLDGRECRVTASIGIALHPADAHDEQALMKNADAAMYRAKDQGKNNFQFWRLNAP